MTVRQFHLCLLSLMLASVALVVWIDHPGELELPHRYQLPPPKLAPVDAAAPAPEKWLDTPRARPEPGATQPPAVGGAEPSLPERWRSLPIQAAVYWPDAPAVFNHLRLGPPGRVRDRLAPVDRERLWAMVCRLLQQSPGDLEFLGFDALLTQAEGARRAAFLATTRPAFKAFVEGRGEALPPEWDKQEGSPRGTLVWWLALEFSPGQSAPLPAGAFHRTDAVSPSPPRHAGREQYEATIGGLTLHAVTDQNLLIISPSQRVLDTALDCQNQDPAPAGKMPAELVEVRHDFDSFRQALTAGPAGDIRAFADGHLLADALETAIPENWLAVAQVRRFENLQVTGRLQPNRVEWTASLIVPQRSIYDFIALDGPRRLDRYLPADSLGVASLRLNFPALLTYAVQLAGKGYFGGKAQQSALFAGPLLAMSNLPDALGYEVAVSLAPSQDRTYLAWSFALPWRLPHTVQEIAKLTSLVGVPFDGPQSYRGEKVYLPHFKAKMEFRYPVLIEAPQGYDLPARAAAAAAAAPAAAGATETPAAPPNDNVLLVAANGWNLDDVLNVKQGQTRALSAAPEFQKLINTNTGDAAIQIYANLSHGFGYAYVTLLAELYGLPVDGTPLEEPLLPRSEAYGPLGHLWVAVGREKLAPAPEVPAAAGTSRLRFHIVWIMD